MLGRINYGCLIVVVTGAILLLATRPAHAQSPAVVAYYPTAPTVAYVPEARGLFGLRTVYRPVIAYRYAPMTTYYAPPAATTMYYPSANAASYYRSAPASYYQPATTMYYPPANVTSYYRSAPASYYQPATTTYYAPANVTSYYAPAAPFYTGPSPVTVRYAPRPVIPYTVFGP
jgi:hypothetical protein